MGEPAYSIGDEWTPSPDQIEAARQRLAAYRASPSTRWRGLEAAGEISRARAAVISATAGRDIPEEAREALRILRVLALDEQAEYFARDLQALQGQQLIELRHPHLQGGGGSVPIGYRFITLTPDAWLANDFVNLYLNGDRKPLSDALKEVFKKSTHAHGLIELYVSFFFDHVKFDRKQYYVVRDPSDFLPPIAISGDPAKPEDFLTAQFRIGALAEPPDVKSVGDAMVLRALEVPREMLIPPTVLRLKEGEYADVFATIVQDRRLFHVGMRIFKDGKITVDPGNDRQRTAEGRTLPLIAVRSFEVQRAALKAAYDQAGEARTEK
jgi:hypothetical protein